MQGPFFLPHAKANGPVSKKGTSETHRWVAYPNVYCSIEVNKVGQKAS